MLTELSTNEKVVGAKQVRRAIEAGNVQKVFLADDADPRVIEPIAALCGEKGITTVTGVEMRQLGQACGIAVGAAMAATLA